MSAIYIHIPFCEQRCYYCAFTVAVSPQETYQPYVERVAREIELSGFADEPHTIYFGGGTPSIVPASMIARLLALFPSTAREITIEANPGTLPPEKLSEYREIGISRISLGAQSLEDEDLARAGRLHQAAAVFTDFENLRRAGFTNINLDLIAGLPEQRMATWRRNLAAVTRLRPEHVSIYMLELEERSAWGRRAPQIQTDEEFAAFYEEASSRLESCGYVQYEISNWALPGFECRHNLAYWTGVPYRGFGVSAHSYDGSRRYWNTASLKEYAERVDAGLPPIAGEEALTDDMKLTEGLLLGLRQARGIDVLLQSERAGRRYPPEWFAKVRDLQEAGLVHFDQRTLKLTPRGRLVADGVIEELLCALTSSTSEAIR